MWRRNGARAFARRGPRGLRVRPRSGRPRRVGAAVVAGIKAANHPSDVTFRHGGARSSWPPRRDAKGRARRIDFVLDGAPLVVGGGNQVMALPVLDLPAQPRLRSKSDVRPRPPLALLRRRGTPPERLRDLGQREVLAHGYAGEAFGALSNCHTPLITVVAQTQDGQPSQVDRTGAGAVVGADPSASAHPCAATTPQRRRAKWEILRSTLGRSAR
jgi:hypothetical protein